jgi:hypothetical protein
MGFDDGAAYRQAHPHSGFFGGVKSFEGFVEIA